MDLPESLGRSGYFLLLPKVQTVNHFRSGTSRTIFSFWTFLILIVSACMVYFGNSRILSTALFLILPVAPGENIISRSSTWLSTTAPRWNDPVLLRNNELTPNDEVFCGCGHPHNLLIPKGNDCFGGDGEPLI